MDTSTCTISEYLLRRLEELGVRHLFGVPGDYNLDFLDHVTKSPLEWIGNCNELNAGYAADGYARLNGLGVAVVTYGVGGFSLLNAVAGAYAEQVSLLVISGAPHSARRKANAMVHHLTSNYQLQLETFQKVTIDAAQLSDAETGPAEIDRVLRNCVLEKRPAYVELPLDVVNLVCASPVEPLDLRPAWHSDPDVLEDCVLTAADMINRAKSPLILLGVETLRFGLASIAQSLVETVELPFATMVNSKSVLPELHPQFAGIYQGSSSIERVRRQVETSDCILALGVWMTDFDTGGFTANIDETRVIRANHDSVKIGGMRSYRVRFVDFMSALRGRLTRRDYLLSRPDHPIQPRPNSPQNSEHKLTAKHFYQHLSAFIDDNMVLMPEPGDAICAAPYLPMEEAENFLVQAYYMSIGYALPAVLGVSLARPKKRALVLSGDGAFQMTAQELSTLIRHKCPAIIFVINNGGYIIERLLHSDGPFNDIQNWKYHRLPEVFGEDALSFDVRTENELESALATAKKETGRLLFIEVHLEQGDCSDELRTLAKKI